MRIEITKPWLAGIMFISAVPLAHGQTLVIPQIADGGGWQTTLVLTNTTAAATTASLSFFQEVSGGNGATASWPLPFLEVGSTQNLALPAGSTLFLHTPGTASTTSVGWAQLPPNPAVVAYAIFTQRVPNRTDQDGTANAAASATRVLVPFDNTKNFVTSVAVANPTGAAESISVGIQLDAGGSSIAAPLSLPAQGHKAFTVPQQFTSTAGQSGLLEFYTATGSISVLALRFNPTGSFTTAPVYPETGSPIIQGSSQPGSIAIGSSSLGIGSLLITFPGSNGTYSSGSVEGILANQGGNPIGIYNATWNSVTVNGQTITFNGFQSSLSSMQRNNGSTANIAAGTLTLTLSGTGSSGTVTGSLNLVSTIATISGSFTGTFSTEAASSSSPAAVTFYVAQNGNDSWSGLLPAPNSGNTDGPFATLDRARAAIQPISKAGTAQVNVQLRAGTYFLAATEMLTAADSGSATTPVVYQSYPGESPVISGGMRVQGWTNTGGNTWKATLPVSTQYFENLFYNGVRRLRPRLGVTTGNLIGAYFRNVGPIYLTGTNAPPPPASAPNANCSVYFTGSGWECYDRFHYNPSDPIVSTWKNLAPPAGNSCGQPAGNPAIVGDIELVDFEQYSVSKLRLSCVDTTNHIVYLTGDTATEADHPSAHGFIPGHRYLIENVQDDLTQPGQWFLDRSVTPWVLTYLANPGENPNTDAVIVPQLTQVLVASNLQYVTFQGLAFEHDNTTIPAAGYGGDTEIISALSFQNSQHIMFDSSTVAETSGTGLEFVSCIDKTSPNWCVTSNPTGVAAYNVIENSAFYDLGSSGIRIGASGTPADTNANVVQFNTVQNTVVEGYGRIFTSSKGISQGQGHDNLYTHNDVYDGYKGAIKVCYCANSDVNPPFTNNNVISFNHVYNLFQGIMNDSGSIYFGVGTPSPPSSGTGNKMLNNKVHDVSDASVMDPDGYGGDGLYADDFSGQVDMENNLIYRVSGNGISFSGPRAGPNQSSTVKNNIVAFARQSLLNAYDPYSFNTQPPQPMFFTASNNLFYFDRTAPESFYVQGGCTYPGAIPYTAYQQWTSNLYWRTDGAFATDPQAFHVQQSLDANGGCANMKLWNYYTFAGWQGLGEDVQSVVKNPGFKNPTYPADALFATQRLARSGFRGVRCDAGRTVEPGDQPSRSPRDVPDAEV